MAGMSLGSLSWAWAGVERKVAKGAVDALSGTVQNPLQERPERTTTVREGASAMGRNAGNDEYILDPETGRPCLIRGDEIRTNPTKIPTEGEAKLAAQLVREARAKGQGPNPPGGYWDEIADRLGRRKSWYNELRKAVWCVDPTLRPSGGAPRNRKPGLKPERTVGKGASSVYVYHSPNDRELAELKGASRWACKIGRSVGDPLDRVHGQSRTAFSHKPKVALVLSTDYPRELETALHAILTLRGQHITEAAGTEWFLTNPEEIEAIAEWVLSRPPDQVEEVDKK
jgi:hypothetical protein